MTMSNNESRLINIPTVLSILLTKMFFAVSGQRTLINSYLLLVNLYLSQLVPIFQIMPILGCRTLVSNFSCQITY